MKPQKNENGNIVMQDKDNNCVSTFDVAEAKTLAGRGYSVMINKSGTKIVAETKKEVKKESKKK